MAKNTSMKEAMNLKLREGDVIILTARRILRPFVDYDHAALIYPRQPRLIGEARRFYTIEAGLSGVRCYRYGHWNRPWVVLRPRCAESVAYDAVTQALRRRGDNYAFGHLRQLLAEVLRRKAGLRAAELVVCHELVIQAYRDVGLDLVPGVAVPLPGDLVHSEIVEVIGAGAPK